MKKVVGIFLLIFASLTLLSCEGKGKLVIKEPPNADVYINGKHIGKTPIEVELKEGKYTVEVATSPFDMERKKDVWVYFDHTTELSFKPKPKGLLVINSKPEGAVVMEGRNPLGKTPFKDKVDVGEHHIVLKLGAVGASRTVNIEYGKTTELFVNLEKAVIHFNADPPDAILYVDGKKIGSFPQTLELDEGIHKITVEKGAYRDTFTLKVKKGDEFTVKYVLKDVQLPPIQAYGPISFTPDHKYLITMGKAGIYFWDLKKFKPQISLYDPKDVRNFDKFINYGISEDGQYVVGIKPIRRMAYALPPELKGKKVDKILVWDLKTTFPIMSKLYPMEAGFTAISKDKTKVYYITKDGKVKIADLKTGELKGEVELGHIPTSSKYVDGKVYIGTKDGYVLVFDTATDQIQDKKQIHTDTVSDIQTTRDKDLIITASKDGQVKLLTKDLSVNKVITVGKPVYSAGLSPSKDKIAIGTGDKMVEVQKVETGETLYTIQNLKFIPISVLFADEEVLIVASSIDNPNINIFKNGHLMKKWLQTIQ
ncbi:MAG: PEGA domain-containing protein [Aquificae bacterium]|nr:PEGA domain-containing protein [Aquificota bacterium]